MQPKINLLKKIEFQILKNLGYTPTDEQKVAMAQSILNAVIGPTDTIVDADMPSTMFGATLDWSAGGANDSVVSITIGGVTVTQDLDNPVNVEIGGSSEPTNLPFIFTVKTDNTGTVQSGSNQIKLPFYGLNLTGINPLVVDWGDGNSDDILTSSDPAFTHTYTTAGTYDVSITNNNDTSMYVWPQFNWFTLADSDKVIDIKQWGAYKFRTTGGINLFNNCDNILSITATDEPDFSTNIETANTFDRMFYMADGFTGTGLDGWNVSGIESFQHMFNSATSFVGSSIINWDVSGGKNFYGMLSVSSFNEDISGWTTTNAENMGSMFGSNTAFNQDISGWDTSKVTNMLYMFNNASSFDQNLASWDVSQVADMQEMFTNSGMSTANYSDTLIGWAAQSVQSNVTLGAGSIEYSSAAQSAHDTLVNTYGWTITDGGLEAN